MFKLPPTAEWFIVSAIFHALGESQYVSPHHVLSALDKKAKEGVQVLENLQIDEQGNAAVFDEVIEYLVQNNKLQANECGELSISPSPSNEWRQSLQKHIESLPNDTQATINKIAEMLKE